MTHPVRVPRDALTIPAYSDQRAWDRLTFGLDVEQSFALFRDMHYVWPWLARNSFRYYVPEDSPIHLARDGRTVYIERFLVRTPSPWNRSQINGRPWDRYVWQPGRNELRTRLVGYPITRPLHLYAPTLAHRIGADR